MLQSQINYWNLQEQKRHNKATEEASFQQSEASLISANASRVQSEIAKELMPFEKMKAQATQTQAQASIMQADAALQNAETNRGNLDVNRINAATNQRNAEINQQNADINAWNAAVNQQNANTNAFNAETNRMIGESNINRNEVMNFGTIVSAGLDAWKTNTEKEIAAQEQQKTPFTTANQIAGLVESGTHSLKNVADSAARVVDSVSNAVSGHGRNTNTNSNNQSGLFSNSIVSSQIGLLPKILPVIKSVIK